MTDWPTYETLEQQQARAAAQTPPAPMAPVRPVAAFPTWAGVTLAITVGLLLAMSVVAVAAATTAIEAKNEIAVLKAEVVLAKKQAWDAQETTRTVSDRLVTVESELEAVKKSNAELASRARDLQNSYSLYPMPGGTGPTPSIGDVADVMSIMDILAAWMGGY